VEVFALTGKADDIGETWEFSLSSVTTADGVVLGTLLMPGVEGGTVDELATLPMNHDCMKEKIE
jgi:hypothetical protein